MNNAIDLLAINWNMVTMVGLIIAIIIAIYIAVRVATGFQNPYNIIDKIVGIIAIVTFLMVFGYSLLQNMLYSDIGKAVFFGSLILITLYFVLFYRVSNKKSNKNKK